MFDIAAIKHKKQDDFAYLSSFPIDRTYIKFRQTCHSDIAHNYIIELKAPYFCNRRLKLFQVERFEIGGVFKLAGGKACSESGIMFTARGWMSSIKMAFGEVMTDLHLEAPLPKKQTFPFPDKKHTYRLPQYRPSSRGQALRKHRR